MILDDLFIAIQERLLDPTKPDLKIASIAWYKGQPEEWEADAREKKKSEPLRLPCVLVRYEEPEWKPRGRKHYEAEGLIYLDIVQKEVDHALQSDRRDTKVNATRASYTIVQEVGKRIVGMRGVGYGTFGMRGIKQDHDFSHLRVDTILFRSLLCMDMDANSYETRDVPDLVINDNPPMPVPTGSVRVHNSDDSYDVTVTPPNALLLPNVTHTDSDLTQVTLPAMTPFVATPASAGGSVNIIDQDNNVIATIPAPGSYPVIVLDSIDDAPAYGSFIINDN